MCAVCYSSVVSFYVRGVLQFGGEFAPDQPTDEAANEWFEAAKHNGLPLTFELEIITSLVRTVRVHSLC